MTPYILFCPCCCSTVEGAAEDGEEISEECTSCGQQFTLVLSQQRIREHSIH